MTPSTDPALIRSLAAARGLSTDYDIALTAFAEAGVPAEVAIEFGDVPLYMAYRMHVHVPGSLAALAASGMPGRVLSDIVDACTSGQTYRGSEVMDSLSRGAALLLDSGVQPADLSRFAPMGMLTVDAIASYGNNCFSDFVRQSGALAESLDADELLSVLDRLATGAVAVAAADRPGRQDPVALDSFDIWARGAATDAVQGAGKLVAAGVMTLDQATACDAQQLRAALELGRVSLAPLTLLSERVGRDPEALAGLLSEVREYGEVVGILVAAGIPFDKVQTLDDYDLNGLYRLGIVFDAYKYSMAPLGEHWEEMRLLAQQASRHEVTAETQSAFDALVGSEPAAARAVKIAARQPATPSVGTSPTRT